MNKIFIRIAEKQDLPAIVSIYNQAIKNKATADTEPISIKDREHWMEEHSAEKYPVYVSLAGDEITGWCSVSPYRKGRKALDQTAEISYYLDYSSHGKGIGSALVKHAINEAPKQGIKNLFALILESNKNSEAFIKSLGFDKWGFMPAVANFDGIETGHLIYGKRIAE